MEESKNPHIVHHSISDLYKALKIPLVQNLEFTIHFLPDIHTKLPFKSPVFRAEYFSFVFVKKGKGAYTTDEHRFEFEDHTIYFTNPGHIKSFDIESSNDAYIITLTETFLLENIHPKIFDEFPFLLAETVAPMRLSPKEYKEMESLYLQIFEEFEKDAYYKDKIMGNLFIVLLLKIKERFWGSYNPLEEGDRNSQIVQSFKKLLEVQFKSHLTGSMGLPFQLHDYAEALNLHPNYLSTVIKSKTGKTVNQWLNEKLIASAKTLLKTSDLSSKEISYRLGFSEPTHFGRFFKKHTGQTPKAYKAN